MIGIARVRDDQEAIQGINGTRYGLTASIWIRDRARRRLWVPNSMSARCFSTDAIISIPNYLDRSHESGSAAAWYLGFYHVTRPKAWNFRP